MIDVTLLGTGGTVPLPERWLTSLLVRWEGRELLIDCGEGTQIALHAQGLACKHIDTVLFTHYHADHTAGLPGLLLSMAKADRTEPVTIIGPKGLQSILQGVYMIARYIPFDLKYMELTESEQSFQVEDLKITAFAAKHSVPCYGYDLRLDRKPKFEVSKAEANEVPRKIWSRLQKGESLEWEGRFYEPSMVLGEERKGIKLVYSTDTRPTARLKAHAKDADLLIAEGMYGDSEKEEKASLNRHSTMQESARLAKDAGAKRLWFTHYSPSMEDPALYQKEIESIYPGAVISKDGENTELSFENEEDGK
jgi:ribonuclease Z